MEAGTFDRSAPGFTGRAQAQSTSGKAVASLVLGIIAVALFFIWAPVVFGPLAIVFGVLGRNEARGNPAKGGQGIATAGMVLGILGLVLLAVVAVVGFAG